jgi:hypothetical protein
MMEAIQHFQIQTSKMPDKTELHIMNFGSITCSIESITITVPCITSSSQHRTHARPNSQPSHVHAHRSTKLPPLPRSTTKLTFRLRRLGGNSFAPVLHCPCFPRTPVDGSTFHNSPSCSQRIGGAGPSINAKNKCEMGKMREFQLNKVAVSFVHY